jgi:hypothetical protein
MLIIKRHSEPEPYIFAKAISGKGLTLVE